MPRPQLSQAARPATRALEAMNARGQRRIPQLAEECALTLFLDNRERVTLLTLGDNPEHLVPGWLLNQQIIEDPNLLLLRFVEDVGHHNAVDAIAGWMALQADRTRFGAAHALTARVNMLMIARAQGRH